MILDVMMPRKDGYELCREVKQDPQYKDITIVLLTAVADHVATTSYTHMDGKTTPADDFIPKPIDLDKLMEIVQDESRPLSPVLRVSWLMAAGGPQWVGRELVRVLVRLRCGLYETQFP